MAEWAPDQPLPEVQRSITLQRIASYADASGDRNPLHLDPEFAASTQFGGIISHGMLTLALLSEMLTGAFGEDWLKSGRLRVRFKGAAYPGDILTSWGNVSKVGGEEPETSVECAIGLNNQRDEEIISGTASLSIRSRPH